MTERKVHFINGMLLVGTKEEIMQEVAPPGWGHTKAEKEKTKPDKPKSKIGGSAAAFDRARKEGRFKGSKADMFKLMWWMKNKGGKPKGKPHYKPGTDEKYKKYQDKDNGVSEEMENVPPRDKAKIKARFKTLHKRDLKGTLPEAKRKPLKGDPIELGGGFQGTLPEGKTWKDFKRAITAVKKGKEQKKPEKAMDAGARAKRVLARKEYAAKVSGSTENVPDDIRD